MLNKYKGLFSGVVGRVRGVALDNGDAPINEETEAARVNRRNRLVLESLGVDKAEHQLLMLALHDAKAFRPGFRDAIGDDTDILLEAKLGGQYDWPPSRYTGRGY